MKTVTIYTYYQLSAITFGVNHAICKVDKPNICHAEEVGYALTITIPDGAKLETNDFGDALLYLAGQTLPYILAYNDIANRVEGGTTDFSVPVKGLRLIDKVEI